MIMATVVYGIIHSHGTEPNNRVDVVVSRYHAAGLPAFAAVAGVLVIAVLQSRWNHLFAQRFRALWVHVYSPWWFVDPLPICSISIGTKGKP